MCRTAADDHTHTHTHRKRLYRLLFIPVLPLALLLNPTECLNGECVSRGVKCLKKAKRTRKCVLRGGAVFPFSRGEPAGKRCFLYFVSDVSFIHLGPLCHSSREAVVVSPRTFPDSPLCLFSMECVSLPPFSHVHRAGGGPDMCAFNCRSDNKK